MQRQAGPQLVHTPEPMGSAASAPPVPSSHPQPSLTTSEAFSGLFQTPSSVGKGLVQSNRELSSLTSAWLTVDSDPHAPEFSMTLNFLPASHQSLRPLGYVQKLVLVLNLDELNNEVFP